MKDTPAIDIEQIVHICTTVPPEEVLAQLAEESAELTHAALKLRRTIIDTNPTPVSEEEAWDKLREEFADVLASILPLDIIPSNPDIVERIMHKLDRWANRLRAAEDGKDRS